MSFTIFHIIRLLQICSDAFDSNIKIMTPLTAVTYLGVKPKIFKCGCSDRTSVLQKINNVSLKCLRFPRNIQFKVINTNKIFRP